MQAARRRRVLILTSRLGRRTEAGPRQVLARVRPRSFNGGFRTDGFLPLTIECRTCNYTFDQPDRCRRRLGVVFDTLATAVPVNDGDRFESAVRDIPGVTRRERCQPRRFDKPSDSIDVSRIDAGSACVPLPERGSIVVICFSAISSRESVGPSNSEPNFVCPADDGGRSFGEVHFYDRRELTGIT